MTAPAWTSTATEAINMLIERGAFPDRIAYSADATIMFCYSRGVNIQAWIEFERDGDFGGVCLHGANSIPQFLHPNLENAINQLVAFAEKYPRSTQ